MSWSKAMYTFRPSLLCLLFAFTISCSEEVDLQTETTFESALVIEATITNELKQQKVLLSRTYRLESVGPALERDAIIRVVGDGINHDFHESEPGLYLSNTVFAAQSTIDYQLEITTSDGKRYQSTLKKLTPSTQIDDLFFEQDFIESEGEGVSVFVNSFDATGESKYYRYTFEETFKIIAPLYNPLKLIVIPTPPPPPGEDFPPPNIQLVPRDEQVRMCYKTTVSNTIMSTSTADLFEDRVDHYRIKFINSDNFALKHRYSILVRQYVQSQEAYTYYKTLNAFSTNDNAFSDNQTGFLEGNIFSLNTDEKAIGFFEVASVDVKRIYFNYLDVFPDDIPPYAVRCDEFFMPEYVSNNPHDEVALISPLEIAIESGMLYFELNDPPFDENGEFAPYVLVISECGDCTNYGVNMMPEWWVD